MYINIYIYIYTYIYIYIYIFTRDWEGMPRETVAGVTDVPWIGPYKIFVHSIAFLH